MNAQDRAYSAIKGQILSCRLEPGSRVVAQELAEVVGVSRTPVREALSRLEQEDMVVRESGWGYVVKTVDLKDVMDLYRLREVLEVEAAVEAISCVDEARIAALSEILQRSQEAVEVQPYSDFLFLIRAFTASIAEMTGNRVLRDLIARITDRIQIVGALMVRHNLTRAREILAENVRILEALERKDQAAVVDAMRTHIRNGRDAAARMLATRAQQPFAAVH